MGADAFGERSVGGGGEVDGTSEGVLFVEVGEELPVVGEVDHVEGDGGGDVLFEGGLALGEPGGEFEEEAGVMAGEGEGGVDEGVGFDEGSVEIDAEGAGDGGVGGEDIGLIELEGQTGSFLSGGGRGCEFQRAQSGNLERLQIAT